MLLFVLSLALGAGAFIITYFLLNQWRETHFSTGLKTTRNTTTQLIEKNKTFMRERLQEAKNKADLIIKGARREFEAEVIERKQEFQVLEATLNERQGNIDRRFKYIDNRFLEMTSQENEINQYEQELQGIKNKYNDLSKELIQHLEEKSHELAQDTKKAFIKVLIDETEHDQAKRIKELEEELQGSSEKRARAVMASAMNRFSGDPIIPKPSFNIPLTGSNLKGKIIGRNGRNIKTFHNFTGITLEFQDENGTVAIVSQDSFRKEIARQSLLRLIEEERFNPGNIERVIKETESRLQKNAIQDGIKAFQILKLGSADRNIYEVSGKLMYRYSYNQNIYYHSIEMAFLGGLLASEIKENVIDARRASFLHDIGKVLMDPAEGMGGHAVVGAEYAAKFGEKPHIVHAIGAHHDEYKPETVLDDIVKAADALSGGRPGARIEAVESFVERMEQLQQIVTSYEGVTHCYVMHAGREIRAFVDSESIGDQATKTLARQIADRIEKEVIYPGQIKVIVIRENRAIGTAA